MFVLFNKKIKHILFIIFGLILFPSMVVAAPPKLNFSDLISGLDTGLGDGLGSGVIVTVWGQNLGSSQGTSSITFTDANNVVHQPANIYYWKNADGTLPGGPANLYESHKMQEIAFSIPDAAIGSGTITVSVNGETSNSLPFRVADTGSIYWVTPSGNNNNNCSYTQPCEYINGDIRSGQAGGLGNGHLNPGDIVYSKGAIEPQFCTGGVCSGMFFRSTNGTRDNLISIVSYPGFHSKIESNDRGFETYLSGFISLSKYIIRAGDTDPALPPDPGASYKSDFNIEVTQGRYIGNYLAEKQGKCATGWAGSILAGGTGGEGAVIYGMN